MIVLTLSEPELQSLVGLMDAGLRSVGLQGADAASHLLRKISEAKAAAVKAEAGDAAARIGNVVSMHAAE